MNFQLYLLIAGQILAGFPFYWSFVGLQTIIEDKYKEAVNDRFNHFQSSATEYAESRQDWYVWDENQKAEFLKETQQNLDRQGKKLLRRERFIDRYWRIGLMVYGLGAFIIWAYFLIIRIAN
jgi:hypothetical protein